MRIKITLTANGHDKHLPATSYSMAERIIASFAFAFNQPPMFNQNILARQGWMQAQYHTASASWHAEITDTSER